MKKDKQHICPWWVGYFLLNPLRKLSQNPKKMLGSYVEPGMKVLDFGSAMGFFSLPMADMVGEKGRVVCVDVQEKMLNKLKRRALKANLLSQIEPVLADVGQSGFGLQKMKERFDFALAFAVVHEVPDQRALFAAFYHALKPGGQLLFAEPSGHVSKKEFKASVALAKEAGFVEVVGEKPLKGLAVVLAK